MNFKPEDKNLIMSEAKLASILEKHSMVMFGLDIVQNRVVAKSINVANDLLVFQLASGAEFRQRAKMEQGFELKHPYGVYITGVKYNGAEYDIARDPNEIMPILNKVVGRYAASRSHKFR